MAGCKSVPVAITADISLMRSDVCRARGTMRDYEGERERERYSIRIRRKLLCCHQPFGGKHCELVCVAESGYNCLDMDIVSMDRGSEE